MRAYPGHHDCSCDLCAEKIAEKYGRSVKANKDETISTPSSITFNEFVDFDLKGRSEVEMTCFPNGDYVPPSPPSKDVDDLWPGLTFSDDSD